MGVLMTKKSYYLVKNGKLISKEGNLYFLTEEGEKIPIPVERLYSIYVYGSVSLTSGAITLLSKSGIPVHFFSKYGFPKGTFYPRETLVSGDLLVKQVSHYLDEEKRLEIAREILRGSFHNMRRNLLRYKLEEASDEIKSLEGKLEDMDSINRLMSLEGKAWDIYYNCFNYILPEGFEFDRRSRRPPQNMVNALISFSNSLIYSTVLTEIYNTQLNPTVSFLHEPSERRFSLSLDLSEIFKPFLGDRVIFKVLNKGIITEKDFSKELNYCLLTERGKRKFLTAYDERLSRTIKHRSLGRKVSYRRLIRLECYKLIKHLLGMEKYESFKMWW